VLGVSFIVLRRHHPVLRGALRVPRDRAAGISNAAARQRSRLWRASSDRPTAALRRKEWTLLRRDPWLLSRR